jgi:hypothetical protein
MTLVRDHTSKLTREKQEIPNSAAEFPQNSSRKTAALDLKGPIAIFITHVTYTGIANNYSTEVSRILSSHSLHGRSQSKINFKVSFHR